MLADVLNGIIGGLIDDLWSGFVVDGTIVRARRTTVGIVRGKHPCAPFERQCLIGIDGAVIGSAVQPLEITGPVTATPLNHIGIVRCVGSVGIHLSIVLRCGHSLGHDRWHRRHLFLIRLK